MKRKTHILIVSQYFYPEPFRINDMAREWVRRGYRVTVLTGIPNYPAGRFYPGYGYWRGRRERWKGVDVIRLPLIPRGSGAVGLAANYVSFAAAGLIWNRITRLEADVVFTFEVSPMTQALIGVWYAKKHGVPHYLYVQDLWPENVETVAGIHHPAVIGLINRMVDFIYRQTDQIFAASPCFVTAICTRRVRVDAGKVHYWPQYAEDFYQPCGRNQRMQRAAGDSMCGASDACGSGGLPANRKKPFFIVFTGNIGYAQGLEILPETAAILKEEHVKFVMIGDGRYLPALRKEIARKNVREKFVLYPRQQPERIPQMLGRCDAAFLSFMDTRLFEMTIPAKLQSYLACGMPVLASASGETRRLIEQAQCGICTPIGDARALAEGVRAMMRADRVQMGKNSRAYFEKNFEWHMLMDWFEQYLKRAGRSGRDYEKEADEEPGGGRDRKCKQ